MEKKSNPRISPGTQWDKDEHGNPLVSPGTQWDKYPTQEEIIEFNRKKNRKEEMVDHPIHYGGENNTYEAIKVIDAWGLNFNLGNTIKYISRADKKINKKEDLEKAAWYLNREINKIKNEVK
tara:strand:+ start:370 stop:735 length:366 start_codon:yes stop_codon:yes gene_type:complete